MSDLKSVMMSDIRFAIESDGRLHKWSDIKASPQNMFHTNKENYVREG